MIVESTPGPDIPIKYLCSNQKVLEIWHISIGSTILPRGPQCCHRTESNRSEPNQAQDSVRQASDRFGSVRQGGWIGSIRFGPSWKTMDRFDSIRGPPNRSESAAKSVRFG